MNRVLFILIFCFPYSLFSQTIIPFAGNGLGGGLDGLGDGLHCDSAILFDPVNIQLNNNGILFFGESLGQRIRKIDTFKIITNFAGNGNHGFEGDNGQASSDSCELNYPSYISLDKYGNVYIADNINNRIRKVDKITNIISTVAGNGIAGYGGDNGSATNAEINDAYAVLVDSYNNIYISDYVNSRIRKVDTFGIISTIAGNGILGSVGDGGYATNAEIAQVVSLAEDNIGNLYLGQEGGADTINKIRKIDTNGIISTIAGTGAWIYNGTDIPATAANFGPVQITFDNNGYLIIADFGNSTIRRIDGSGIIHTIAGNAIEGDVGDYGPATAAEFDGISGVAVDSCGNIFISQVNNPRIREVVIDTPCHYSSLAINKLNINNLDIKIYPNPAQDELHIEGIKYIEKYRLLNIKNNIAQAGNLQMGNNTIHIHQLPPGMYFLEMIDEKGYKEVRKVVKVE